MRPWTRRIAGAMNTCAAEYSRQPDDDHRCSARAATRAAQRGSGIGHRAMEGSAAKRPEGHDERGRAPVLRARLLGGQLSKARRGKRWLRPSRGLSTTPASAAGAEPDQPGPRISRRQASVEGSSRRQSHDTSTQKPGKTVEILPVAVLARLAIEILLGHEWFDNPVGGIEDQLHARESGMMAAPPKRATETREPQAQGRLTGGPPHPTVRSGRKPELPRPPSSSMDASRAPGDTGTSESRIACGAGVAYARRAFVEEPVPCGGVDQAP
jgi:hypothetical protein